MFAPISQFHNFSHIEGKGALSRQVGWQSLSLSTPRMWEFVCFPQHRFSAPSWVQPSNWERTLSCHCNGHLGHLRSRFPKVAWCRLVLSWNQEVKFLWDADEQEVQVPRGLRVGSCFKYTKYTLCRPSWTVLSRLASEISFSGVRKCRSQCWRTSEAVDNCGWCTKLR